MNEVIHESEWRPSDVHKTLINEDESINRSEGSITSIHSYNLVIFGRDLGITKDQLISVVILSLNFFLMMAYFSLFAPFFPAEATKKGMGSSQIGIIFGIYQLVILICSPIFGKNLNAIGPKFLVSSGMFIATGSLIAFGFLNRSPGGLTYFILCLASRVVGAFGSSMGLSYAIVGYLFPKNIASVVAVLEIFAGLGLMVGPVIGGSLYEIGGFSLPFFAMGCTLGMLFIVTIMFFPNPEPIQSTEENTATLPMLPLLKILQYDLTLLMLFCGSFSLSFIEPLIQIHLLPLGLRPFELGLVFFIPAVLYVIVTPFIGHICDKYPRSMPWFMMISAYVSAIAFCFFGPFNFFGLFDFKLKLSTFLGGYMLLITGFSGLIIPVYAELTQIAEKHGYPKDLRTQGIISGTFSCAYSTGALLGPIIGGIVVDLVGFNMVTFMVAILLFVTGVTYMCFHLINGPTYVSDFTRRESESEYLLGHEKTASNVSI